MSDDRTDLEKLHMGLKTARERLCRSQTLVVDQRMRPLLDEAVTLVDRVGIMECPDWSRHNEPEVDDE